MEIKIDKLEITEDQVEVIVKVKGAVKSLETNDSYSRSDLAHLVKGRIADAVAKEYMANNMSSLLESVNKDAVLNKVLLLVADKIRQ